MAKSIPLVRAGDIAPLAHWLHDTGRPATGLLDSAGIPNRPWEDPNRIVAYTDVVDFVQAVCLRETPDMGVRLVTEASLADMGDLGALMLATASPREALIQSNFAMANHNTHEVVTLETTATGMIYRLYFAMKLPAETMHFAQQYGAALVRSLCLMSGSSAEPFDRIEMTPHPVHGFAHIGRSLGPVPVVSRWPGVALYIPNAVLDQPFPHREHQTATRVPPNDSHILSGHNSYSNTAQIYIDVMLDDGAPSIERLAAVARTSLRTLQRRLADEGTSYSALLDESKRRRALHHLTNRRDSIGQIATELGYADPPSFTRAVRRWVDAPPKQIRKQA